MWKKMKQCQAYRNIDQTQKWKEEREGRRERGREGGWEGRREGEREEGFNVFPMFLQ